jgi:hypothetical protein
MGTSSSTEEFWILGLFPSLAPVILIHAETVVRIFQRKRLKRRGRSHCPPPKQVVQTKSQGPALITMDPTTRNLMLLSLVSLLSLSKVWRTSDVGSTKISQALTRYCPWSHSLGTSQSIEHARQTIEKHGAPDGTVVNGSNLRF